MGAVVSSEEKVLLLPLIERSSLSAHKYSNLHLFLNSFLHIESQYPLWSTIIAEMCVRYDDKRKWWGCSFSVLVIGVEVHLWFNCACSVVRWKKSILNFSCFFITIMSIVFISILVVHVSFDDEKEEMTVFLKFSCFGLMTVGIVLNSNFMFNFWFED